MLITFRSKAAGSITMFEDPGKALLKLMGTSGVIPGALQGDDVGTALTRLREGLTREGGIPSPAPGRAEDTRSAQGERESTEPPIRLATRAVPLIDFLECAAKANADVIWESG